MVYYISYKEYIFIYDLLNNYDYNMYSYSLKGRATYGVVATSRSSFISQLIIDISSKTTVYTTNSVLQINLMCTDQL